MSSGLSCASSRSSTSSTPSTVLERDSSSSFSLDRTGPLRVTCPALALLLLQGDDVGMRSRFFQRLLRVRHFHLFKTIRDDNRNLFPFERVHGVFPSVLSFVPSPLVLPITNAAADDVSSLTTFRTGEPGRRTHAARNRR